MLKSMNGLCSPEAPGGLPPQPPRVLVPAFAVDERPVPEDLRADPVTAHQINENKCVCLLPLQFFAMGVSSVFIMLLSRSATCGSAVAFISAAMGLFSFTSGYVGLFKSPNTFYREDIRKTDKLQEKTIILIKLHG